MAPQSEDDFGLSSGDEAELAAIADDPKSSPVILKRKHDDDLQADGKRIRLDEDSVAFQTATRILQERFGLQQFRLKQAAAITRVLEGGSSVVVFPTGGGKSLCYQVPGVAFKEMDRTLGVRQGEGGITVVVSPLIALMKDQVDALKRRGISAAVMDSTKTKDEFMATIDSMRNGTLDILYCAPERLNNEGFVGTMAHVRGGVRLLAVDEAHCISEWGHAFRPDYLKVARFAKEIQAERVICLTATATPQVAKDVCKAFNVPEEGLFRTSTYRSNLRLLAYSFMTKKESYPKLTSFLKAHPGSTIIYITTQKQSEELAEQLRKSGFKARHFHAGMKTEEKTACQEAFMASSNLTIVATIAFGMGIDKANIRNVIHYDIPRSLEGYSQEVGRAGRDGLQSQCVLYLCAEDFHLRESFARGDLPSKSSVTAMLNKVFQTTPTKSGISTEPVIEISQYQQAKEFDIKATVLGNIYAQLELRFNLLRASTPKYTSYSYKELASTAGDRSAAALAIAKGATKAKVKFTADVDKITRSSGLSRGAIVAKLNDWNDSGLIDLETAGVMNVYRVLQKLPSTPAEKQTIIDALYDQLVLREQQELDRMKEVTDLITNKACLSRSLAEHFGDTLPDKTQECGHCIWCESKTAVPMVMPPQREWDSAAFSKVLDACPDRDDPRYLARIAFGISSPRATAAKMSRHAVFGSMEDHDFMTLLQAFTKICDKGAAPVSSKTPYTKAGSSRSK